MAFRYTKNLSKLTKNLVKQILNTFGWSLVKKSNIPRIVKEDIQIDYIKSIMDSSGVLHIGAHRGFESHIYYWFGKDVIWIEANPEIFEELKLNIYQYGNQKAYNYLLTNKDDEIVDFNISNNDGASSSIFNFGNAHLNFQGREFKMIDKIKLKTIKLETLFEKHKLDCQKYNFWVIDVQGAELLVLDGAKKLLNYCQYLYIEISIEEFYKNAVTFEELDNWLTKKNFKKFWEPKKNHTNLLYYKN
jgi:FkbM family methyltransferase